MLMKFASIPKHDFSQTSHMIIFKTVNLKKKFLMYFLINY